jgi:hypothetical protein
MFQRISLRGSEGEELFWGFSVLRSDPPPPVTQTELPTGAKPPSNDNAAASPTSHMRLRAVVPEVSAAGSR